MVEILAGLPSVVLGFLGIPWLFRFYAGFSIFPRG